MITHYNDWRRPKTGTNEAGDVGSPPTKSWAATTWLMSLMFLLFFAGGMMAQTNIASYSFASSTSTYTPLVGGTVVFSGAYDDGVSAAIPMGGTFPFGGANVSSVYINTNGYINFGVASSNSSYTPLSTLASTTGAIAAFAQDAGGSTVSGAAPEIKYLNTGSEFVVQYQDHANFFNRSTERLNFQIRLNFATGAITIVYGTNTDPGTVSTSGTSVQVGIRGNSTTYATNVNNLMAGNIPAATTCDWSNAVTGISNSSTLLFSGTTNVNVKIPTGLTYTWSPATAQLPVRIFQATTAVTASGATLSWTAPTGATQYNVQYRTVGTCNWTNWSGNPVATNSVVLTGLNFSTKYQVRVQALNGAAMAIYSHIPNLAGTGDGYTANGTFTTLDNACAGTPVGGTVAPASSFGCTGIAPGALTLSGHSTGATGITFQWQDSTDGSIWNNVTTGTGATTTTYTPGAYAGNSIQYRAVVTCTASGLSANSATATINPTAAPTTQASALTSGTVTISTIASSWTNGNGTRRMVILSNSPIIDPVDGNAPALVASAAYSGAGQQIIYDGTGTSVTATGLTCNTTYYFKVYEYNRCGAGPYDYYYNTTTGTNATTFATSSPVLTSLPANNTFAGFNGSNLATSSPGWYEAKGTAQNYNPSGTTSLWANTTLGGMPTARINLFSTAKNDWIISPRVQLTAASRLQYKVAITGWNTVDTDPDRMQGTDDKVRVLISTDGCGAVWTPLYTFEAANTTTLTNVLTNYVLDLSAYTGQIVQVAFQATDGTVDDASDYDFHVADIKLELVPSCEPVASVAATNLTPTTADVSWVPSTPAPGVGYEWAVTTSATPPASGTATAGTSATATDLVAETQYYLHVRSECIAGSDYSNWVSTSFRFLLGDQCAYATNLDALTSPIVGTTVGYTNDFNPTCDSSSGVGADRFYSITVPAGYSLAIGLTASSYDSVHSVYYGNCTTNTLIQCLDPELTVTNWVNSTGSSQTVYWAQDAWTTGSGTYTLAWTLTPPPIVITSFTPATVCSNEMAGTVVTLTGTNFTGATMVEVNNVSTPFTVVNDTTITVTLTATTTEGFFKVTNAVTSGTSATQLDITPSPTVAPITNGDATVCVDGTVDMDNATPSGVWSTSDEDVATVDGDGVVTGTGGGTATISYTVTDFGCSTTVTSTVDVTAPIVSTQPAPQTVVTGDDAVFSVVASGDIDTYQWMVSTDSGDSFTALENDGTYGGVDTNTLTITNTPDTFHNNLYMVYITAVTPCEDFPSEAALLKVGDVGIANHPENVTLCSTGNGTAVFTVLGSGTVDSYSWEENQGFGFAPIANGTFGGITFAGADTNTLTVSGLVLANSGRSYRGIAHGPANSAPSNAAIVTIYEGPTVSTHPANATVCYSGGTAVFSATAAGNGDNITGYQWQYSTDNSSFSNVANGFPTGATYSNADTNSMTVTTTAATPATGTYYYQMVIMGQAPCTAVNTNSAQLLINTPVVTEQPMAANVMAGNTATFTVATDAAAPSYQWQYSTNGTTGWANVANATPSSVTYSGENTATLSVNVGGTAAGSTARYYRAIVTSSSCSVNSNAAQLTIVNYCIPSGNNPASYFDAFSTTGGVTNINNIASGYSTAGYGYFVNLSASELQGSSINFNSTIVGPTVGAAIWIDWNQNTIFEASERVAVTTGYISAFAGSFAVPVTALPGNTRMRIVLDYGNSAPSNPCLATTGRREYEDYTFTVLVPPACSGAPVAGTAVSSVQNVCYSGSATLSVSGYSTEVTGISFQWYNSAGAIPTATNTTYVTPVLTSPETYYVRVTCSDSAQSTDSNSVTIGVDSPAVTSVTDGTRCGTGSVALNATGSAGTTLDWYSSAAGGTSLYTGSTFNTPSISTTTTYYVGASMGGSSGNAGVTGNATSTNTTSVGSHGILFTTTQPNITINSADIPFTGTGTMTIALKNGSNGTTVATVTTPVVTGNGLTPVTVPVGLIVPAAGNYSLIMTAVSGTVGNLGYKSGTYPSTTLGGAFSVTNGYWFSASASSMYFFNVGVSIKCQSALSAVTATVETAPVLTISSSSDAICVGETSETVTITSNTADFDTYMWSPSTGVSGNATSGYTFTPSATTTYTLSASQNGGAKCTNSATFTVTVNPYPSALTITPASPQVCSNGPAVLITANGGTNTSAVAVGTGTAANTTTSGPTPYGQFFENSKAQYLIRASELTTLGLAAGNQLNNIAFNVVAVGTSGVHENYTISIGHSIQPALVNLATGLTTVFGPVDYQPVVGTNTHAFSAPFVWDGISNVVVQICHTNDVDDPETDYYTVNAIVNYTVTTFNSSMTRNADNADACANMANPTASANRPNMVFNVTNPNLVTWSPSAGLFTDAAASQPYGGGATRTIYAKPTTTSTYTATSTTGAGCSVSSNVTVTVSEPTVWYADADGDGYGTSDAGVATITTCTQPAGYSANNTDCNDSVFAINPGKTEILYNGVDDDCSGTIDDNNQIVTQVITEQCGTTLPTLGSSIYAFNINNATAYRFEVTNTTTGAIQTLVRNVRWFSLTMLPSHEYATTYSIRVEIQRNNVWLGYYGPSCLVSSPAILAPGGDAQVGSAQCGSTLPSLNSIIYTNSINNATGYRFRITNMTDPTAPNQVQTLDRNLRWFNLTMFQTYNYGTTYQVEVSIKTTNGYSGYGSPCLITTPAVPMLTNCGATIASDSQIIYTTSMHKATSYRFELTHAGTGAVFTIDRPLHWFKFSMFPGYDPGAEYGVRVAVMTTGVYSPYGDACSIFAPGSARAEDVKAEMEPQQEFKAIAYPNPYADTFKLDVTTSSSSNIQVKVYDMIGKLLEVRDVPATDMQTQQLGDRYPSGVYNIIVTQDATVKTLRVIKR